jgi:acyl-CoA thioesterase I
MRPQIAPSLLGRIRLAPLLFAAAVMIGSGAALADTVASPCAIPDNLMQQSVALPKVAASLRAGGKLDILAVGSATLLGPLGTPSGSFPDRMAQDLRAAAPGATVNLAVFGSRGASALHMLTTIRSELTRHPYGLVLWQTGTVEALRRVPPAEFRRVLSDGAAAVHAAGADLVLIEAQYSRMLVHRVNIAPYTDALHEIGASTGTAVFPRLALMQHWVESGQIDLEQTPRHEREAVSSRLQACLGDALARMVLRGADEPPEPKPQ